VRQTTPRRPVSPSKVAAQALADCARADRIAKGLDEGNAWQVLLRVALRIAGATLLAEPA
jgi:hypothetical protein